MKKHISLLLALMMLFTMLPMGMTAVSAEGINVTQSATDLDATTEGVIDISTLQSEITLTFGSAPSTTEGIAFTKADGTAIKGAVVGTAATDGLTYTLEFGRLEAAAEYKLVVPAAVTGGEEAVFNYKAVEGTRVDINTEFNEAEYVVGQNPTSSVNGQGVIGLHYTTTNAALDSTNANDAIERATVVQYADTDKAIEMKVKNNGATTPATGTAMAINAGGEFNTLLKEERDVYVVDAKVKTYTENGVTEGVTAKSVMRYTRNDIANASSKKPDFMAKFASRNILKTNDMKNFTTNVELGNGSEWKSVRSVVRMSGYYGTGSTIEPGAPTATNAIKLEVTDLYDVSGSVPVYYGETNKGGLRNTSVKIAYIGSSYAGSSYDTKDLETDRIAVSSVYARKDKAMTVLKTDAYTKAGKSVVFHMSDDIDAATLSTITVANEAGEAVNDFEVNADNTNRTITVSFPNGLTSAGNYTVGLGSVLGTNGVAVYNGLYIYDATAAAYTHENLATRTFTVSAEEAGGVVAINEKSIADNAADVSVHVGEVTLSYTEALDDDTLDGISIVSVDGVTETAIKGKLIRSLSDDGKTVTLTFGRLAAGAHKIKVNGDEVKTAAGDNVATEEIAFTTVEALRVDVNTEFGADEGFVVGQAPTDTRTSSSKTGLRYHYGDQRYDFSTPNYNSAQNMTVIADGTDDQALELAPKKVTADDGTVTYYGAELGVNAHGQFKSIVAGDRDVYVIDAAVKSYASEDTEVASPERNVFIPTRSDFLHGGSLGIFAVGNVLKTQKLATAANNGIELGAGSEWKKVRAVIRDNGTLGAWSATPVKPKANATEEELEKIENKELNLGVTSHQRVDLYDVTGAVPKYIGENATATADDYAYTIARIVKPTTDTGLNSRIAVDYVYARKDKAMTVLEADTAYTKDNKKLVFYMTDDIDAASKDNVVVKLGDAVISDRTVTVDNTNRSLTIEFAGLTAGDYTVDLRGVMGTNGVGVWNGKYEWNTTYTGINENGYVHQNLAIYSFDVLDEDGAFVVSGVTSGEEALGNTLDADAGELTIAFSSAIADGAEEHITLTKANETRIGGIVVKNVDGNNVTLKFGRLEEGEDYKLDIPDAVTRADGTEVIAKSYTFTATREYLINAQDQFANITSGTVLHEGAVNWDSDNDKNYDESIMSNDYADSQLSNSNFRISLDGDVTMRTTEGGDKYLEIKPAENHANTSTYVGAFISPKNVNSSYTFNGRFMKTNPGKVLALDVSMNTKAVDGEKQVGHNASLLAIYHRKLVEYKENGQMGKLTQYAGTASVGGLTKSDGYTFDTTLADGEFGTTRLVVSSTLGANATSDTNSYKVYDLDKQQYMGYNFNPGACSYDALARLAIQSIDTTGVPGSDNVMVNLKDYKAFLAEPMDVLATEFDAEELKLTIWLTDEIDATTASKAIITTGEGDSLKTLDSATYDVVCNDADRALEITFPWGLPADNYSVSLANVEPKNGLSDGTASASFEVTADSAAYMTNVYLKGSVGDGELLNLVGGNAQEGEITISDVDTVQITAEIGGCDTACAFLAVYDADWELIDCVAATKDGNNFTASIDGLTAGTTKHARFFIWKDVETLEPLFRPLECL